MSGMHTNLNSNKSSKNPLINPSARGRGGTPFINPVSSYIIPNPPIIANNNNLLSIGPMSYGPTSGGKHTVHWFRRGLRLHDNPSLREGVRNSTTYRCIFILDPWFAGSSNVGINKWRYETNREIIRVISEYLYL
jgi:hypothetical protein